MENGQELEQTYAYNEGQADCFLCKICGDVAVNPYDPDSEDWQEWEDGFYDAQWKLFDL